MSCLPRASSPTSDCALSGLLTVQALNLHDTDCSFDFSALNKSHTLLYLVPFTSSLFGRATHIESLLYCVSQSLSRSNLSLREFSSSRKSSTARHSFVKHLFILTFVMFWFDHTFVHSRNIYKWPPVCQALCQAQEIKLGARLKSSYLTDCMG